MNATFYKLTTPNHSEVISHLCTLLNHRDYHAAEVSLVRLLKETLEREYNTTDDVEQNIADIRTIYLNFNEYYLNWAQEHGVPIAAEKKLLAGSLHSNYLFAHCNDPESMDDLVYAVADYLLNIDKDEPHDEAVSQLNYYSRQLSL